MTYPLPAQLLPHAGSAVLLDEIVEDTDEGIIAVAAIDARHPFYVDGRGVPAWVGIELMAQAVAAHSGLRGHLARRAPRRGMLLGTRRYRSQVPWFAENTRLHVHAAVTFGQEGGMAACACRIVDAKRTVAEATIVIIEEDAA